MENKILTIEEAAQESMILSFVSKILKDETTFYNGVEAEGKGIKSLSDDFFDLMRKKEDKIFTIKNQVKNEIYDQKKFEKIITKNESIKKDDASLMKFINTCITYREGKFPELIRKVALNYYYGIEERRLRNVKNIYLDYSARQNAICDLLTVFYPSELKEYKARTGGNFIDDLNRDIDKVAYIFENDHDEFNEKTINKLGAIYNNANKLNIIKNAVEYCDEKSAICIKQHKERDDMYNLDINLDKCKDLLPDEIDMHITNELNNVVANIRYEK